MTSYRIIQNDLMVEMVGPISFGSGGSAEPSGGDYCAHPFRVQNGNAMHLLQDPCQPRISTRIADWPPRRELSKESLLTPHPRETDPSSLRTQGFQNGQLYHTTSSYQPSLGGFRGFQKIGRRRSKDVEFQDGWPRSPGKTFIPLRNRSNSEITLSECEVETFDPPRGIKHGSTGMPLFREYGSTSSIDVQGIPEQSFFEMLNEFRQEMPDQRSAAPEKLNELLRADASPDSTLSSRTPKNDLKNSQLREDGKSSLKTERTRKKSGKSDGSSSTDSSIFRKLRSSRSEVDTPSKGGHIDLEDSRLQECIAKSWCCQKSFAHYDVQSILFNLQEVVSNRICVAQRKNTTTGASAASAVSVTVSQTLSLGNLEPAFASTEDLNYKENLEPDLGDSNCNDLLLSCPHFRNEIGGTPERNVSFLKSAAGFASNSDGGGFMETNLNIHCTNASISVLEITKDLQNCRMERLKYYAIEHVDLGALYYHKFFHNKEHFNYFGVDERLGPIAVSIRREKLEDGKDYKEQYQYRIIFRTSELITLRGTVLEDAVPSTTKHGTLRGLPLKDVLEYIIPELSTPCLRLAMSTPKVTEQLLKLDEQGLSKKHKVGILFCKADQCSEEEMYNNEEASPAFEDFLSLLGEKVCLKGFTKYAAQLDTKTDSTGTHSLYTTYQDYEIMFHVSTMLPYTPNNRQQLLRKRHIGNDIVTIIFQEPGALPFTPQSIRSHFQHVFVIVHVHNPGSENVCYSVAVTRSKDVPSFGPPIPNGAAFHNSNVFRDFLLAKVINAENAAHKSDKFHTMATRTRQEYLKDLAENCVTNTPIDSSGKFNLISLASKKKEKTRARDGAELESLGAIVWHVSAQDFSQATEINCFLGISDEFVVLLDIASKEVVFNCFCEDVIGWTPDRLSIKIFYGRGDHIFIRVLEDNTADIREIIQRLKVMTKGCETVDMTLRRNGLGQLGFHVKFDGTVAEVEEYGFAWQAGLRQGSRLVEICKVAVVTLSHEQMIDLLRTSVTVKVVIIPPYDDGVPRRGCTEEYEMRTVDQKPESDTLPAAYRAPYRSNSAWQWSSQNASQPQRWMTPGMIQQPVAWPQKPVVAVPYREPQPLQNKRPVSFPETPYNNAAPRVVDRIQPYRNSSGSFSSPGTGAIGPLPRYEQHLSQDTMSSGESSSGFTSQESTMERVKSGAFPQLMSKELIRDPMGKGGSSDSGIDASTLYTPSPNSTAVKPSRTAPLTLTQRDKPQKTIQGSATYSGLQEYTSRTAERDRRRESSPAINISSQEKGYRTKSFGSIVNSNTTPGANSGNSDVFRQTRAGYTPQGYKTPGHEKPKSTKGSQPGSHQLSTSVPKSFYSKSKHLTSWKKTEETSTHPGTFAEHKKQPDNSKNVFGQPRLRASLRDLRSPRKSYKSTIEDDLKKLIIMDKDSEQEKDGSPRKTLQRTFSDESICSGRRDSSYANSQLYDTDLHNDLLFTSTLPTRKQYQPQSSANLPEKKSMVSASELSLSEARDKNSLRRLDPGMMPLPDTTSGLEWSSLVSAAKAYEVQRAVSLFSLNDSTVSPDIRPVQSPGHTHTGNDRQNTPRTTPTISEEVPPDLTGRLYHLEVMLKQLHNDLEKEKKDKVALLAEVACLRENNHRLQEESLTASEQLKKFSQIFSNSVERK
uniref:Signal induced proliferation associated 1 like 3 n=1 Tax=Erpetoichthys calabaricus TaxID=27687 RepID=A0A8C4RB57_ERPCA